MSGRSLCILYAIVLGAIVLVDYSLGETAEYLNVYELLRQTLAPGMPQVATHFLAGQTSLGSAAGPLGGLAWLCEGALVTWMLAALARLLATRPCAP